MTEIKSKRRGRKKGIIDDFQKAEFQKNREMVLKAHNKIISRGNIPTISGMEEEIRRQCARLDIESPTRTTIYLHWNPIRKQNKQKPRPLFKSLGNYERFLEEIDPNYQRIMGEIEDLDKSILKRAKAVLSGKYFKLFDSKYKHLQKTTYAPTSVFNRRIKQLDHSLNIRISAKKETWYFKYTMQNELAEFVMKLFYLYFYRLGFYKKPESVTPILLQIKFDPLKGTIKFLEEQIDWAEWRLINGRFRDDFEDIVTQLLKDHVEHYRLIAIKNGTFNKQDFEQIKGNLLNFTKTRILARIDKEGTEMFSLFLDTSLKIDKRKEAATLEWKAQLKKLLDKYSFSSSFREIRKEFGIS